MPGYPSASLIIGGRPKKPDWRGLLPLIGPCAVGAAALAVTYDPTAIIIALVSGLSVKFLDLAIGYVKNRGSEERSIREDLRETERYLRGEVRRFEEEKRVDSRRIAELETKNLKLEAHVEDLQRDKLSDHEEIRLLQVTMETAHARIDELEKERDGLLKRRRGAE